MTIEQFKIKYERIFKFVIETAERSRREGLLAIEETIDKNLYRTRDPMMIGLQLVVDGTDSELIKEWYSNVIEADCSQDPLKRVLYRTIETGILGVQTGHHPRIISLLMDSICPSEYRPDFLKNQKGPLEELEEQLLED
jgi:flagellar motor component MotA